MIDHVIFAFEHGHKHGHKLGNPLTPANIPSPAPRMGPVLDETTTNEFVFPNAGQTEVQHIIYVTSHYTILHNTKIHNLAYSMHTQIVLILSIYVYMYVYIYIYMHMTLVVEKNKQTFPVV